MMNRIINVTSGLLVLGICGCSQLLPQSSIDTTNHLGQSEPPTASIPDPVRLAPALPEPVPEKTEPTHTVVVNAVPIRELLFSLARDADLNLDIDSNVEGKVTLNAINQPLPAILDRIAEGNNLRYSIKNDVLRIQTDTPFIRNYRVDYLNLTRKSYGKVSVSTQISATGQGAGAESADSSGNNNSSTDVENSSDQAFWETLQTNIAAILGGKIETSTEEDQGHQDIVMNRGAGIIAVRATHRQHREIQAFIDEVLISSQRQVLIEATIAEVKLSDRFQAGIDWSLLQNDVGQSIEAFQTFTDITLFDRPSFNLTLTDTQNNGDVLQTTLSALESFGDVSVMSSPKVMAMNNQTALLKVVDNLVYFTVDVNIDSGSQDQNRLYTFESEIHTVPVGFVMSVTPYISESGQVTLNVRPTISRVIGQARDPNPAISDANIVNEIPIIQVREVESVLKVGSGDIAVIGGLMQDELAKNRSGIPILSRIPWLGSLFRYQDDRSDKTELVIFIKPVVVNQNRLASESDAYSRFQRESWR